MIKFLIMDVDGTLTDGKIYMAENGELFKAFDIKDGYGIKEILPQYGITPIIITARSSKILQKRCEEIGIKHLYQGVKNKTDKLLSIINGYNNDARNFSLRDCAYIGDDLIDEDCMISIKEAGGVIGCPKDAVMEIKVISDFVSRFNGGNGAVRDFINWLVVNFG